MPNRETSPHRTRPKRRVNLIGATSTIVGFVIGASIFILPGPVAGIVGPGLPLAYLLAVIPAIFACLYLVQLGSVLPVTGSNYVVATRFGSPPGRILCSLDVHRLCCLRPASDVDRIRLL